MATDQLTRTFRALADPTRRAILGRLTEGEASVGELAEPFRISAQAVSKHLKVLEQARIISRTRTAQSRPCVLETGRLDEAVDWVARHRQVWADRHDLLAQHLTRLRRAGETQ